MNSKYRIKIMKGLIKIESSSKEKDKISLDYVEYLKRGLRLYKLGLKEARTK